MSQTPAPDLNKRRETFGPNCTCDLKWDTSGRFPTWRLVECNRTCPSHGWKHVDNLDPRLSLAANLRYGD